jgi:hypothetical protein
MNSFNGSNLLKTVITIVIILMMSEYIHADVYFEDGFSDANLASRGWYDDTSNQTVIYDSERGGNVLQFNYSATGMITPCGPLRHILPEAETIHVRYYIKYSDNWSWTGLSYGPHEFYLLTNKQSSWDGPSYTNLTCYIEVNNGKPHVILQDGMNINTSKINQDLTQVTEDRAIAGGNGCSSDGYSYCGAYSSNGTWNNSKGWMTNNVLITNGKWYLIEAEFKLNSITNGISVPDGHIKYWLNNNLIINHENVILRTDKNAGMKFNQLIIGPYFHPGVPHAQKCWIDDLKVSNDFIGGAIPGQDDVTPPVKPTGVTLQVLP